MQKVRIIIADMDENYIMPLKLKFIQDFFDKIDLEIITDRGYFIDFFNKSQNADILIVSEELYDLSIQRHAFSKVFVLVERYEAPDVSESNVISLLKYTSIEVIFKEIVNKSYPLLDNGIQEKKSQIIVVTSASGSLGKTTIAMGISAALEKNYKRVLYINADRLQSFQHMLEDAGSLVTTDIFSKLVTTTQDTYFEIKDFVRKEIFSYLPPFKSSLLSLGLEYSIFEKIANSAKRSEEFDFIIIDAEETFDEEKTSLLNIADKVVVVINQGRASVLAANLFVSNVNGIDADKYVFVCNDFDGQKNNAIQSKDAFLKFSVNEYVGHFSDYDKMLPDDFANDRAIQKVAFLVR